jgi:hypothetical protein
MAAFIPETIIVLQLSVPSANLLINCMLVLERVARGAPKRKMPCMNSTFAVTHARTLVRFGVLAFVFPVVFLTGCTANPFLMNYRGDRMTPVLEAQVVQAAPATGTATEIGSSAFLASTPQAGDAEALEAAREVGAELVQWSCVNAGAVEGTEMDPVYQRRAQNRGNFGTYAPIPGQRESWTYTARFWRTSSAAPAAATPASSSSGVSQPQ